jgi:tricorn protease
MKKPVIAQMTVVFMLFAIQLANAASAPQIHGMRFSELSPDGKTLVFTYQGDLWSVESSGGIAHRITTNEAYDRKAKFSPDGLWLAFESDRCGNPDIFIMPADGSNDPKRITYSSDTQQLWGWHPSNQSLITGIRGPLHPYITAIQDLTGGIAVPVFEDIQYHLGAVLTSDGSKMYYLRAPASVQDWRTGYRGSAGGDIWLYNLKSKEHGKIYSDNRSKHFLAMGHDETYLLFVDYVNQGSSNLAKLDLQSLSVTYLTNYSDDTVRNPATDKNGTIVYEYMNDLWRLEPGKEPRMLEIFGPAENRGNDIEYQTLNSGISTYDISSDQKLAAVSVNNDICVYRLDGEVDNKAVALTNTSDIQEFEPAFSKDGKSLYFIEDDGWEYHIVNVDLKTLQKKTLQTETERIRNLERIPDSEELTYIRGFGELVMLNPADNSVKPLKTDVQIPWHSLSPWSWTCDQKYLGVHGMVGEVEDVYIIERETGKYWNVSKYFRSDSNPRFSPDGRWLAYQTDADRASEIKLVRLKPETFLKETVLIDPEEEKKPEDDQAKPDEEKKDEEVKEEEKKVEIDFDRIDERARIVSFTPGYNSVIGFSPDGEWLFYSNSQQGSVNQWSSWSRELWKVPTDERSKETPVKINESPDDLIPVGDKLYASKWGKLFNFNLDGSGDELPFSVNVTIDRTAEKKLALILAGQVLKEYFYDKKMHGADWKKVRQKYLSMLDDARTPEDVAALMNRLNGELNASHLGAWGPTSFKGQPDQTADLGLDFDPYFKGEGLKIRKILKDGPSDKPDIDLKPDDVILEIEGQKVGMSIDPSSILNHKVGEVITLKVHRKDDIHEVKVKADSIDNLQTWKYETWIDENKKKVDEWSHGKIGYLHIRSMGMGSFRRFEKEYLNMTKEKEGIIIDVRYNPGGWIHELLLDVLDRRTFGYAKNRGWDEYIPQPWNYNRTQSVVLINESSTSDAEIFPYAFKQLGLGKLIGMETYGAVIGTNETGLPGGFGVRLPEWGWYRLDYRNLENEGVKPDIEIPFPPDAIIKGDDPQLKRAVEELLRDTNEGIYK